MKVSREQVQQHRERILAAASQLFRERGFDGVSVADVMKAVGAHPRRLLRAFRLEGRSYRGGAGLRVAWQA